MNSDFGFHQESSSLLILKEIAAGRLPAQQMAQKPELVKGNRWPNPSS
jgi:hypothetical protein